MKIPKTTKEYPYIEFRINESGTISFEITSSCWGGIDSSFSSSNGDIGNACLPEDLKEYIFVLYNKSIEKIDKDINKLKEQKEKLLTQSNNLVKLI